MDELQPTALPAPSDAPAAAPEPVDPRQQILAAIRALADPQTGRPPTRQVFMARAGYTPRRFHRHFTNYAEAVREAGLEYVRANRTCTPNEMLTAYGTAVRACNKLPNQPEFWAATRHHSATLIRHVGSWADAPARFLDFAGDDAQWADVVAVIRRDLPRQEAFRRLRCRLRTAPASLGAQSASSAVSSLPGGRDAAAPGPSCPAALPPGLEPCALRLSAPGPRPLALSPPAALSPALEPCALRLSPPPLLCGAPLAVPGLSFAPVNEAGVVVLFALLAVRLGFNIVAVQAAFPDCVAQREVAPGRWQLVRIEFEYESRSFVAHRHPADGCDLIVCWRHNWPDCPPGLEVLELEREV